MISFFIRQKSRCRYHAKAAAWQGDSTFIGAARGRRTEARRRLGIIIIGFAVAYIGLGSRLIQYGLKEPLSTSAVSAHSEASASRPDIVDRNGELLATDLKTVSLYAEPLRIVDADEVVERLATVIADLDWSETHRKLRSQSAFQWIKRQLTPRQQADILGLGLPGIGFRPEKRRFYPGGATASHILGHVDIDNKGLAGMELYVDQQGLAELRATGLTNDTPLQPVTLSVDVRVQHAVREVVADAMDRYEAEAAGAVVLDVETGEVLAMASVPDYDPNEPSRRLNDGRIDEEYEKGWFNRISNATFEMGSTFKSFTLAMGLDEGKITLDSVVDASRPIKMGGFTIRDFKGKNRPLSIPEVFQYSSNIGTASIADRVGVEGHQQFLTKLGLLTKMKTEMPGVATPTQPRLWKKINSVPISFGHGVATTPLQTAVAAASLVNGGKLVSPTF